jgi:hypothetical protein
MLHLIDFQIEDFCNFKRVAAYIQNRRPITERITALMISYEQYSNLNQLKYQLGCPDEIDDELLKLVERGRYGREPQDAVLRIVEKLKQVQTEMLASGKQEIYGTVLITEESVKEQARETLLNDVSVVFVVRESFPLSVKIGTRRNGVIDSMWEGQLLEIPAVEYERLAELEATAQDVNSLADETVGAVWHFHLCGPCRPVLVPWRFLRNPDKCDGPFRDRNRYQEWKAAQPKKPNPKEKISEYEAYIRDQDWDVEQWMEDQLDK